VARAWFEPIRGTDARALGIANDWVRTKLAPTPISTTDICAGHGQGRNIDHLIN
jgi:hypothetical protein